MVRVLGLIPARGGSKGIPKKNMVEIAGKPLIYYTFSEAKKSKYLDRVLLSTDDVEIAEYGKQFEIEVPFLRPSNLAEDGTPMYSVVEHTIKWLQLNDNYYPDAIMILHPTSPLRTVKHIDNAILEFNKQDVDCLVAVSEPQEHPMEMVFFKNKKMYFALDRKKEISGRQKYQNYFFLNGLICIIKTDVILRNKSFWKSSVAPYIVDTIDSIDIDNKNDLTIADCLLRKRKLK